MKKIIVLILSASMLMSFASCSKNDKPESAQSSLTETTASETEAESKADATETTSASDSSATVLLPGELYQFDKDVVKGITLKGNRLGSSEFNAKDPDVKGIRCVFELNEWVEFYPDTDAKNSLWVYVYKHTDDINSYTDMAFTEEDTRVLAACTLAQPAEAGEQWGSFYLNPEYAEPGVYDIVFVNEGKAVAVMKTKFFEADSLVEKSDEDLTALMKDF